MLQYRASVFLWTLWSLAGPIIHLAVWSSIAQAEGSVGGYDRGGLVAYFIVQSMVYHVTSAWQVYEFGYLIRTGTLSAQLLRPFDPVHYIVSNNVSFKLINLVWLIPIWTAMVIYFRPAVVLSPVQTGMALLTLAMAAVLTFLWVHCWAMVAFWTVRADSFFNLAEAFAFLVGGGIAPLALLPDVLQRLSSGLPFYYMLGFPIEVAIGAVPLNQAGRGFLIGCLWIAIFFGIYRGLWRLGLKRYGAVGA